MEWTTGEKNVVSTTDMKCVDPKAAIKSGTAVKMFYEGKRYTGVVLDTGEDIYISSDDSPLAKNMKTNEDSDSSSSNDKDLLTLQTELRLNTLKLSKSKDCGSFNEEASDSEATDNTDCDPPVTARLKAVLRLV